MSCDHSIRDSHKGLCHILCEEREEGTKWQWSRELNQAIFSSYFLKLPRGRIGSCDYRHILCLDLPPRGCVTLIESLFPVSQFSHNKTHSAWILPCPWAMISYNGLTFGRTASVTIYLQKRISWAGPLRSWRNLKKLPPFFLPIVPEPSCEVS